MSEPSVVAAFQRLQAGDAAGALSIARALIEAQPGNARASLAAGIALRGLQRLEEARAALERAAALDPKDYAAAYELALLHDQRGDADAALASFVAASRLKPGFVPALYGRAALLGATGRRSESEEAFRDLLTLDPNHVASLRALGTLRAGRGDFAGAASLFAAAHARDPADTALPIFLAQAELLRFQWKPGWAAYARRETRTAFEAERTREGKPYRVPERGALEGRSVLVVAEQGLGDILFFLRFVPLLGAARVAFAGDARLHSLLARTGLFEATFVDRRAAPGYDVEVLSGDLPLVCDGNPTPPSLRVAPDEARAATWRRRLQAAGPGPYTGITWRAGTPVEVSKHGLSKSVPMEGLLRALLPAGGTLVAIQRLPTAEDLAVAQRVLGSPLADFSSMNHDLEEALALLSVLDRHVGVSNTNMHLAALAGRTAEVLVPFPPEWRWGLEGESPWYPGFRTYRQQVGGDWNAALRALSAAR